ncbi:MAG TPA: sigma-70 family RNA polymerase sigma factor [Clostridia bacterium]|jgi:RNA polymerase sporulation-specific sigma factor|nr:sigma-70 family RNA polymerase sigma factor [Clostridiaceae bacterium]HOF27031.1 sigma-70 family RNA polymerase sigma factor [Clostridia bacterium]HOM35018.1 sigma-70 family RNA polymerase sigma factor [Clostridia bacterium]HOR90253.1 sigma-70 family RNA polymerase sigma factor [Clostridia bacterium]HOT70766.1 sigma-70 family RNA polymerase sigma factor [Clostridia bacterium]
MKTEKINSIIKKAKAGDEVSMEYLLKEYSSLVRKKATGLFLMGADKDDLLQEGMIGLFKAILNYDETKEASFDTFAALCINRQMFSAIKGANRKKHKLINEYISIYTEDKEDIPLAIPDEKYNPEVIVTETEALHNLENMIRNKLSSMESKVLDMLIEGHSVAYMSKKTGKNAKSVDNAIQRIKSKVRNILKEEH